MKLPRRKFLHLAASAAALPALPRIAKGQAYPSRPLRIVVGFPPGGPPDIAARVLAERLSEAWARPVVVENATGSGGNLAVERVARAQPDGYTLLIVSNAIVINPGLYEKLPYAQSDLAPISLAAFTPCILVVNNNVPAKSVQEIVALARAQPGKLTFGHAGVGTPAHLAGELFKVRAGLDIQAVPYRGMPVALPDLLSGIITMMFPNLQVALPLVRTGQARALAVTSLQRFSATPDIPTMVEQGFPEFEANAWFGLMAPAGTPRAVIDWLNAESRRAFEAPDVRERLTKQGLQLPLGTPEEFATLIAAESKHWADVIRKGGIKLESN